MEHARPHEHDVAADGSLDAAACVTKVSCERAFTRSAQRAYLPV